MKQDGGLGLPLAARGVAPRRRHAYVLLAALGGLLGLGACGADRGPSLDDTAAWRDRVRAGDARALEDLAGRGDAALALMLRLLADEDATVVTNAASLVDRFVQRLDAGAAPLFPALLDAVRRFPGDPRHLSPLREHKALALPAVLAALEGEDPSLRAAAVETVATFGPMAAPAVGALRRALTHPDSAVRLNAMMGLGGIGAAAESALEDLDAISASASGHEQAMASKTAARIRSQRRPGPER